ncbi:MAG: acyl-CoA dehydrogenase family protein, partial [Chloroflexi bacterium]|nr:acyl-CoA dehydrogenase family protein [Chloroflexota bacterium]
RKRGAKGWLTPTWPKEYGGLGLPPICRFILHEELNYSGALPSEALVVGAGVAGPTIMMYGSEQQKKAYLLRIARGEIEFALGYTEPQAGSDLASLQMRAEEKKDCYLMNGQKVYNTRCHFAQYHWIAVRTDPNVPKHKGISLFIVDLSSPGITLRPLWTVEGMRTNEVFYDNVIVPKENLVGEKNRGFLYTVTALEFERVLSVGGLKRAFESLLAYVKESPSLRSSDLVRQKISQIAIEIEAARLFAYRLAWLQTKRTAANYEAAASKLFTSELSYCRGDIGSDAEHGRHQGPRSPQVTCDVHRQWRPRVEQVTYN